MEKKSHLGKAGQLAAMAEFLLRGYNVAIPEVDVGDPSISPMSSCFDGSARGASTSFRAKR